MSSFLGLFQKKGKSGQGGTGSPPDPHIHTQSSTQHSNSSGSGTTTPTTDKAAFSSSGGTHSSPVVATGSTSTTSTSPAPSPSPIPGPLITPPNNTASGSSSVSPTGSATQSTVTTPLSSSSSSSSSSGIPPITIVSTSSTSPSPAIVVDGVLPSLSQSNTRLPFVHDALGMVTPVRSVSINSGMAAHAGQGGAVHTHTHSGSSSLTVSPHLNVMTSPSSPQPLNKTQTGATHTTTTLNKSSTLEPPHPMQYTQSLPLPSYHPLAHYVNISGKAFAKVPSSPGSIPLPPPTPVISLSSLSPAAGYCSSSSSSLPSLDSVCLTAMSWDIDDQLKAARIFCEQANSNDERLHDELVSKAMGILGKLMTSPNNAVQFLVIRTIALLARNKKYHPSMISHQYLQKLLDELRTSTNDGILEALLAGLTCLAKSQYGCTIICERGFNSILPLLQTNYYYALGVQCNALALIGACASQQPLVEYMINHDILNPLYTLRDTHPHPDIILNARYCLQKMGYTDEDPTDVHQAILAHAISMGFKRGPAEQAIRTIKMNKNAPLSATQDLQPVSTYLLDHEPEKEKLGPLTVSSSAITVGNGSRDIHRSAMSEPGAHSHLSSNPSHSQSGSSARSSITGSSSNSSPSPVSGGAGVPHIPSRVEEEQKIAVQVRKDKIAAIKRCATDRGADIQTLLTLGFTKKESILSLFYQTSVPDAIDWIIQRHEWQEKRAERRRQQQRSRFLQQRHQHHNHTHDHHHHHHHHMEEEREMNDKDASMMEVEEKEEENVLQEEEEGVVENQSNNNKDPNNIEMTFDSDGIYISEFEPDEPESSPSSGPSHDHHAAMAVSITHPPSAASTSHQPHHAHAQQQPQHHQSGYPPASSRPTSANSAMDEQWEQAVDECMDLTQQQQRQSFAPSALERTVSDTHHQLPLPPSHVRSVSSSPTPSARVKGSKYHTMPASSSIPVLSEQTDDHSHTTATTASTSTASASTVSASLPGSISPSPRHSVSTPAADGVSMPADEREALVAWLTANKFDRLLSKFVEQQISVNTLSDLSEDDLKVLGLQRMGDRKRFLAAVRAAAPVNRPVTPSVVSSVSSQLLSPVEPECMARESSMSAHSSPVPGGDVAATHSLSPNLSDLESQPPIPDDEDGSTAPNLSVGSTTGSSTILTKSVPSSKKPFGSLHFAFLQSMPLRGSEVPGSSKRLDLRQENHELQNALNQANRKFHVCWEVATNDNLLKMMAYSRALHISGHGEPNRLVLEDGKGDVIGIPVNTLSDILKVGGTNLKFAFVSACFSSRAAYAFAVAGVPHVIAVHEHAQVTDGSARAFSHHVYLALCQGLTVREAFLKGRAAVIAANSYNPPCCCAHLHSPPDCATCKVCRSPVCCPVHIAPCHASQSHGCCQPHLPHDESLKFLLLGNGDHDVPLFREDEVEEGEWINRTPPKPHNNLPSIPDDFLGRAKDALQIVPLVLQRRLLIITGPRGIGKSALARAVATYINDRRHFSATYLIRLRDISNPIGIDQALAKVLRIHIDPTHRHEVLHDLVIQSVRSVKADNKPFLFVFDDCDLLINGDDGIRAGVEPGSGEDKEDLAALSVPAASSSPNSSPSSMSVAFREYIKSFLEDTSSHIILTAETAFGHIGGHNIRIHELSGLHPADIARLFVNRSRDIKPYDWKDHLRAVNTLNDFLPHPLFQLMAGLPRMAEWCAELLNSTNMDMLYAMLSCPPILDERRVVQPNPTWPTYLSAEARLLMRKCQAVMMARLNERKKAGTANTSGKASQSSSTAVLPPSPPSQSPFSSMVRLASTSVSFVGEKENSRPIVQQPSPANATSSTESRSSVNAAISGDSSPVTIASSSNESPPSSTLRNSTSPSNTTTTTPVTNAQQEPSH